MIYSLCLNIVKDEYKAQDLTQETFISLYKSIGNIESKNIKNYICRIATNKSIDYRRKHSKINECAFEENGEVEEFKSESIEELIINNENKNRITEIINSLKEPYKTTVIEHYLKGNTYEDIAKKENVSSRTIETRLYRARKILLNKLNEVER